MAAPLALLAAGLLGLAAAPGAPDALWEGVPWGFYTNYLDPQHPSVTNDMLTDAMATEAGRAGVESQLAGMAARNATLWRIFPQFQDVLASPLKVNTTGIAVLTRALDMAAAHGIRVTVTGLSDFVPAHNPAWLRELGEAEDSDALISAASSVWWGALAKAWKGHPAVFSFGTLPAHTPPHTHHPTPRSSRSVLTRMMPFRRPHERAHLGDGPEPPRRRSTRHRLHGRRWRPEMLRLCPQPPLANHVDGVGAGEFRGRGCDPRRLAGLPGE